MPKAVQQSAWSSCPADAVRRGLKNRLKNQWRRPGKVNIGNGLQATVSG
jgi:hypothetical protein